MYLYNLTLQKPTSIYQSITGSFSTPKAHEIVVNKGTLLELYTIDQSIGKLKLLISKESYSQIRQISPFRLTGNKIDNIILLSDSGRIVILQVDLSKNDFIKLHQETFGKTGCRRIVPSEYIGIDPKGRCIMIGALEKQKFVYILNRDTENKMTISSPLEAHKSHIITYAMCGLDAGYDNPLFCCIEVNYGDTDDELSGVYTGKFQKNIVYYEMELSLNHVVRKKFDNIDNSAHLLIPVYKYDNDVPFGGVLVFCENFVVFKSLNFDSSNNNENENNQMCYYPQRYENVYSDYQKKIIVINYCIYKRKEIFFIFVQSELGDLYKINLTFKKNAIQDIIIQYFDTIPVCMSISILLNGYLFCASETSTHNVYSIINLEIKNENITSHSISVTDRDDKKYINKILFNPTELKNLNLMQEIPSLCCINDIIVDDLNNEEQPQIYAICGRGNRSELKVLRAGLSINTIGESKLPGEPIAIWSLKELESNLIDKYIIVSFINATLVLGIGEKISEITNSGFDTKNSTIHVDILHDNSYIQIIPTGILHITKIKKSFVKFNSNVKCACSNSRQIIIGLMNNEMLYFEYDNLLNKPDIKVLDKEIICCDLSPILEGRIRSKYVCVGFIDNTIQIFSLELEQNFSKISMQVLPFQISSLKFLLFNNEQHYNLYIGLVNGVLIKTSVDNVTGNQSDITTKYLGESPIKLFKIHNYNDQAIIACCSKNYLCYKHMQKYLCEMVNMDHIEYITSFNSEELTEGLISIKDDNLKIFKLNNLDFKFSEKKAKLRYTPRKILLNQINLKSNEKESNINTNINNNEKQLCYSNLIIIESDEQVYSQSEKEKFKNYISEQSKDENYLKLDENLVNIPYASKTNWGSCIRIIEPINLSTIELIEFENNEAAFSSCLCNCRNSDGVIERFLVLGTAVNLQMLPCRSFTNAYIDVFSLKENGTKIDFYLKQPVDDMCLALCEYNGKLLAGVGSTLILYEIGKNHLLKKCETKKINSQITKIQVNGQRILVNTMNESFYFFKHKTIENQFYLFADDVVQRWLVNSIFLDFDTICGCDKFENFFVYRLPKEADQENENDPMDQKKKWEVGFLHGAAYKLNLIAQFHLGDLITSLKLVSLKGVNYEENIILYCTISGRIGCFVPFETREEVDFFIHLEMYQRIEIDNLAGRDHQSFRSCFGPVKCVIDGDFCEEFMSLDNDKQKALASELDKSPNDVLNKLEDMRDKII